MAGASRVEAAAHERGVAVQPDGRREPVDEPAEGGEATMRRVGGIVQAARRCVAHDDEGPGAACPHPAGERAPPHRPGADLVPAVAVHRRAREADEAQPGLDHDARLGHGLRAGAASLGLAQADPTSWLPRT